VEGPKATPNGSSNGRSSNGRPSNGRPSNGTVLAARVPEAEPATPTPTPTPNAPPPAKWKRSTKIALAAIAVVTLLEAAAFSATYYFGTRRYVSTDNAQVDGDKVDINAPSTGILTNWTATEGTTVHTDQILGRIKGVGAGAQPQRTIKSPGNGTVAINNSVNGEVVTAGTELATAYDFNDIYVTARVDETDVAAVHPGQLVDIDVDAFGGTPITGTVEDVQAGAAGEFSLFPQSNSTGNFQKVTQVIPVKIALTDTRGLALVPGMNVTVHIHKN
jgi:multidrug resistance efflux pump